MKKTDQKTERRRYSQVGIVILAGTILSFIAFNIIKGMELEIIKMQFTRDADIRINAIRKELETKSQVLQGVLSLYQASEKVTREEFRKFTLANLENHADIQALEWIPRVYGSERQGYEEIVQSEGYPDFRITERASQGEMVSAGIREEYFPVTFVEPFKGNEAALGFDLASDAVRLNAINRSRDTGQPAITSRITLVQEDEEQFGFLEFYPVYRKNIRIETVEERRENLMGFVLGVFRIGETVKESLLDLDMSGINLYIYDESATLEKRFLYNHVTRKAEEPSAYMTNSDENTISHSRTFSVADRNWSITAVSENGYFLHMEDWYAWGALLSSLFITGLIALYINIKARQAINDKMHIKQVIIEEERWKNTFNSITDMVSVHDKEMRIVRVNRAFTDFLGLNTEEVVGRHCYELIHGTNEPIAECLLTETFKTGNTVTREIFEPRFNRYFMVTASPLKEEDNIIGVVHFIKDITERKEAEDIRENLTKELEQIIYITSHDLRSPLVNVEGYHKEINYSLDDLKKVLKETELPAEAKEKIDTIIEQDIPESVRYIDKSILKMDSLLAGLLKLSRTGKAEFVEQELDMNRLVSDVVLTFEHRFKESGARYEIFELPECMGDLKQMNQVFANLIGNALKYLDPERHGAIKVFSEHEDNLLRVYCVEDNGIGISPDDQEKIFDIFHQVESSKEGEGLGLNIVKKIVEGHGGKVWVESVVGKGSKFCIALPIKQGIEDRHKV